MLEGTGGGAVAKIGVQRLLERCGNVRAKVINDSSIGTLVPNVRENVEKGAHVYADEVVNQRDISASWQAPMSCAYQQQKDRSSECQVRD